MAHFLPLLARRLINQPLLVTPDAAMAVSAFLRDRLPAEALFNRPEPEANQLVARRRTADGQFVLAPRMANGAAAVIPVHGELVNRGAYVDAPSGLTSYEGIEAQVIDADADPAVRLIVLDLDSPGGEIGGMSALMDLIRNAETPTVAVVNDMAASAAYGLASACDEILVSQTGIVGSIGVVMLHIDQSAALADAGIVPTLIHAGAHKVDGHPFAALPDAVRSRWQAEIDQTYAMFVEAIGTGRGNRLPAAAARATEARMLMGQAAIDAGLADRIGTLSTALAGTPAATSADGRKAILARAAKSAPGTHKRSR